MIGYNRLAATAIFFRGDHLSKLISSGDVSLMAVFSLNKMHSANCKKPHNLCSIYTDVYIWVARIFFSQTLVACDATASSNINSMNFNWNKIKVVKFKIFYNIKHTSILFKSTETMHGRLILLLLLTLIASKHVLAIPPSFTTKNVSL